MNNIYYRHTPNIYFMSTVINFKTDKRIKEQAQSLAQKFGLSLSDVLNVLLRNFVYKRELSLNIKEEDVKNLMKRDNRSESNQNNGVKMA